VAAVEKEVCEKNIDEIKDAVKPEEHRQRIRVGDIISHYGFVNRHGVAGTLTVWHNLGIGAIQFGKGSFWGKWRDDRYTLKLDPENGGEEFDLAGDVVERDETEN
jgi:hypothetical protein